MFGWFFLTICTLPSSHAFDTSLSVDLVLQVASSVSLMNFPLIKDSLIFQILSNLFHFFSKAWNCWSINAMIKDKSSGYGWGNGMMFVKGNAGALMGIFLVH